MSPDVRRAALLAAAKATFIVSLGCARNEPPGAPTGPTISTASTPMAPEPAPPPPAPAPEPAPATPEIPCEQHLASLATAQIDELPANDPLRARHDVYGAFRDISARTDDRTVACCVAVLRDHNGSDRRWPCCSSALPSTLELEMACTPWGPPCPPALA